MALRTAALLAFIGMLLLSVLLAADLVRTTLAVARDLVPALTLVRSVIYLFASVAVTIFFLVFSRAQK